MKKGGSSRLFFHYLSSNKQTFSTCCVCGNMSTGCTAITLYAESNSCKSRACVAGLQLT